MTARHDARLVPAAVGVYIVAGTVVGGVVKPAWWIVVGLASAFLFAIGPRRQMGSVWLTGLAIAAAAYTTTVHLQARLSGGIDEVVLSGETVTFTGTVASDPRAISAGLFDLGQERWSLDLRLASITRDEDQARHAGAIVVVVGGDEWGSLDAGERVTATGQLGETSPGPTAAISWDPVLLSREPATGLDRVVERLRAGFRTSTSNLPADVRALTVGMTIGDTSGMPAAQVQEMRVAGLTHLTAVSGAQFAMLALAVGAGARALRWNRRIRVILLVTVALGFVFLVRPEPSVLRAAWMGGIVALALLWGRPGQALPALSTAVIGLLLVDPFLALSFGFALSVAATAGIVLWAPVVGLSLARVVAPPLAKALSVPIAAQVVCTPILVLLVSGIGPYAVIANLIAIPFSALVTAFGLASVLFTPVWAPGGVAFAWMAGVAARPVAWIAHTAADLPAAWLPWPKGVTGAVLAACVSTALIVSTTARRVAGWARIALLVATLTIVAATPALRTTMAEVSRRAPGDWSLGVCDVGQGDMILIRAGPSSAIVIDTGPIGGGADACLSRHQVTHVPLLVLTHPHADHDGGLGEVLANADVTQAWLSEPAATNSREVRLLEDAGVRSSIPAPGTQVRVGDASLTVWHAGSARAQTDREVNDASLVVFGTTGGVSFLSLGDLEEDEQRILATVHGTGGVDVLKVAHHGSASQDRDLMAVVDDSLAIISVGAGNPYGHPAPETLVALSRTGATVARTDECGDVDVSRRGGVVVTARCPLDVGG